MALPIRKNKKFSSDNCRLISSAAIGEHKQQPMGSLMTSFGKRRSVRIAQKMNKRILKKNWICNDVWMDILPFFDRPQLGLNLALLSPRFDALVDKHFDGKTELTLRKWIGIRRDSVTEAPELFVFIDFANSVHFPLPDRPLHNKIRFNYLRIEYIDYSVIEFLHFNKQIFDERGTCLDLSVDSQNTDAQQPIWDVLVREIWPIFAPNIRQLDFPNSDHLDNLLRLTSPTILTDLSINKIESNCLFSADAISDENRSNAIADDGQALFDWLHTPRKDGQPKRFRASVYYALRAKNWINSFKEAFLRATTCASYFLVLILPASAPIVPYELVNERTREKLTLEQGQNYPYRLVKRCPIGETIQWEDENANNLNNVSIDLRGVNCIGPLSPPKAGQMNAKDCLKMSLGPSGQRIKKWMNY